MSSLYICLCKIDPDAILDLPGDCEAMKNYTASKNGTLVLHDFLDAPIDPVLGPIEESENRKTRDCKDAH